MNNQIVIPVKIDQLVEALKILGHAVLWIRKTKDQDYQPLYVVLSEDDRELAWFDADTEGWVLKPAAGVVYATPPHQPPSEATELTEAWVFQLTTTSM